MKRFFSTIVFGIILIFMSTTAHSQDFDLEPDRYQESIDQIDGFLDNDEVDKAWAIVQDLQQKDSLSYLAINSCANCYLRMEKYQECINLMDAWCAKQLAPDIKSMLNEKYGEAYYFLENYDAAKNHLGPYIELWDSIGFGTSLYYIGLYANSLQFTHNYKEADKYYKRFFDDACEIEGRPINQLNNSGTSYRMWFYRYGYNCCFLGDEERGRQYIELASSGGLQDAKEDLQILRRSPTFAKSIQLDKKTIAEFEKIIAKYDSKQYMTVADAANQDSFWRFVKTHSEENQKLKEAMHKENPPKTLVDAVSDVYGVESSMEDYLRLCSPYKKGELEKSYEDALFGKHAILKDFRIYPAKDVNAFATPYGQIYLTDGLVERYHFNETLIMGVCAHEATHFVCEHTLISKWQEGEKARKNEILGGIAAGLYMATIAASGAITASSGGVVDQSYWDDMSNNMVRGGLLINESFRQDAYYFKYKYSRSNEIESDIIAYRFCETFGYGGYSYIMALQLLGDNDVYMQADKTDDHPTTKYRVLLLKYLYAKDHPQIVDEVTDTKTSLNIGNNLYVKKKQKSSNDLVYHGDPKCTSGLVSIDIDEVYSTGFIATNLCHKCLSREQRQLIMDELDEHKALISEHVSKFYKALSKEYNDFDSEQDFRDWLASASAERIDLLYEKFNEVYDNFSGPNGKAEMIEYLGWKPQP